jgi:hypothetical protein
MVEPYLTTEQLAQRWGLKPSAIKSQRRRKIGPEYYTLPRRYLAAGASRVRYPLAQVLAFEETNSITPLT